MPTIRLAFLALALAGCANLLPSRTNAKADAGPADAADAADAVVTPPDAGPDADAETSGDDAAAVDIDAGPPGCTELLASIAKLKPALQTCTAAQGCQLFEYPICGSIGCFQLPAGQGKDLSQVEELAHKAMEAQCPGFHCGCAFEAIAPLCLGGDCKMCPPDCTGATCAELELALAQVGKQLGSYCVTDDDCALLKGSFCMIPGLGCSAVAVAKKAPLKQWQALVDAWQAGKCNTVACKCAAPKPPTCVKGLCVSQP